MNWKNTIRKKEYNLDKLGVEGSRRDAVIVTFGDSAANKKMAEKLSDEMNEMVADRNTHLPEKFHSRFYVRETPSGFELRQDAYSSEIRRYATGVLNIYRGRRN